MPALDNLKNTLFDWSNKLFSKQSIIQLYTNLALIRCFSRAQPDMQCEPFIAKDNPEPPKQNFLKSLFGSGPSVFDREELCKWILMWSSLS